MSDYTLPPCSTLVVGMTGCGKTSFCLRYLLNVPAACRFVFDDLGQVASRLGIPHANTGAELESALASRWVVFNPHRMFPGRAQEAFAFFCDWVMNCSRRGPGKKILFADEIWRWCSAQSIPPELAAVSQMGRSENLELLSATQLPHKVNASITGQSTELVSFRLQEPLALSRVKELGLESQEVEKLPLGSYISLNRLSGGRISGRLF